MLICGKKATYHVQYVFLNRLSLAVPTRPVVARATAVVGEEDVFRVEQVFYV